MEIVRGLHNIRPRHRGCALAIGNFDGMHLGHQALLQVLCAKAKQLALPSTLIAFEPQPLEYFDADQAPFRLARFREKVVLAQQTALDRLLLLSFNAQLASRSAEDIIYRLMVEQLGVRYVLVGDDFRFGAGRSGNLNTLQAAGKVHGFEAEGLTSVKLEGERVSSSLIRTLLAAGDIASAEKFLGHPYQLIGRVAHGRKLGRTINVPTANIAFRRYKPPLQGVFAVSACVQGGAYQLGVANIGTKPTVHGKRSLLEVHLLDLNLNLGNNLDNNLDNNLGKDLDNNLGHDPGHDPGKDLGKDLYGCLMRVRILRKIREEQKFDGLESLRTQIMKDIEVTRLWHRQGQLTLAGQAPFAEELH